MVLVLAAEEFEEARETGFSLMAPLLLLLLISLDRLSPASFPLSPLTRGGVGASKLLFVSADEPNFNELVDVLDVFVRLPLGIGRDTRGFWVVVVVIEVEPSVCRLLMDDVLMGCSG